MDALLIAVIFFVLALVQSVLVTRFGLRGFSYRRDFPQRAASCGDTVDFIEVIRNRSPFLLPWVRLEMRIPPSFAFSTKEEVDIRGNNYHKSVFTLMPFSQVTRRHRVRLQHRGHFVLSQTSMTASDLFGIRRVDRDLEAPTELFVYPALLDADSQELPSSRAQGEVSVTRWIQPDPFLINGIRAYRAGDAERDVHWAATARTGELQVKTHDYTADPRLMVIINAQKGEDQWSDLMDYEQPQIEYAISLAATMCMNALEQGTEAGFAANMPLEEGGDCAVLLPARGAGRREEIMRAMACLLIRRIRSFPTFLEQLDQLHGMDIVLLSSYDSPTIREKMELLRRRGNSVTLKVLEAIADA